MTELEINKLTSEIISNTAAALKHDRERWWHPVVVSIGLFAAGSTFTLALIALLTYMGK